MGYKSWLPVLGILAVLGSVFVQNTSWGYANAGESGGPHREINKIALDAFIKSTPNHPYFKMYDFSPSLTKYGIKPPADGSHPFVTEYETVTASGNWNKDEVPVPDMGIPTADTIQTGNAIRPFSWWVIEGGYTADEPELYMALRHFYDPEYKAEDQEKGACVSYLTDFTDNFLTKVMTGGNPKMNAGAWCMSESPYSFKNGMEGLMQAFSTASSLPKKQSYFGLSWRCLGESMHLLADMTVPAHVRNDGHPGATNVKWENWVNLKGDPYEELVTAKVVNDYKGYVLNPAVKKLIEQSTDEATLFQNIALYTNHHFFSTDTISGTDAVSGGKVDNFNDQPNYDKPKLDDYAFKGETAGYYKSKDGLYEEVHRNANGRHEIDYLCAEDQARRLIPIAIAANVKLIDIYLPRVKVTIDGYDAAAKILKCRQEVYVGDESGKAVPSKNFTNPSSSETAVVFIKSGTFAKNYLLPMNKVEGNNFQLDMSGILKEIPKPKTGPLQFSVTAGIDMGGILVKSAAKVITSEPEKKPAPKPTPKPSAALKTLLQTKTINIALAAVFSSSSGNQSTVYNIDTFKDTFNPKTGWKPLTWNGCSFSVVYDDPKFTQGGGYYTTTKYSIKGTVSSDGKTLVSLTATKHIDNPFGNSDRSFTITNIPRVGNSWVYRLEGPGVANKVKFADTTTAITRDGYTYGKDTSTSVADWSRSTIEVSFRPD